MHLSLLPSNFSLFLVASIQTQKTHQLTQFHITNWNSSGKCENLKTVTDVNEEVIKVQWKQPCTGPLQVRTSAVTLYGHYIISPYPVTLQPVLVCTAL